MYYIPLMSKTVTVLAAKFSDFTVFDFSGSVVIKMVVAGTAQSNSFVLSFMV